MSVQCRRPPIARVAPRVRTLALLVSVLLLAAACTHETPESVLPPPSPDAAVPAVGERLVVVLPPVDRLAAEERVEVRRAVERAIAEVLDDAAPSSPVVLEPADGTVLVDTVERAVRRAGTGGTVCVLGAGVRERIAPVLALYPATRACFVPAPAVADDVHLTVDVDLETLGRSLGAAARAAAGPGTVLVLDGGDPMLGRRWRAGVTAAVLEPGEGRTPGRTHIARSADEVVELLDAQAALLADGIVPGGPEALAAIEEAGVAGLDDPLRSPAFALPPVAVVVLDASADAALLVAELAERDLRVVGPRSLLADGPAGDTVGDMAGDTVVLRFRVDWHLPLVALLDAAITGRGPTLTGGDPFVLEVGPAGVG